MNLGHKQKIILKKVYKEYTVTIRFVAQLYGIEGRDSTTKAMNKMLVFEELGILKRNKPQYGMMYWTTGSNFLDILKDLEV